MKLKFKLTKMARKAGGDRYEVEVKGEANPFVIYVPQTISRAGGKPFQTLTITVEG